MNPETNHFEPLTAASADLENKLRQQLGDTTRLLRPDGSPVPDHWTQFHDNEHVVIKGYTFKVRAVGETYILFEPVGPTLISGEIEK